MPIYEYRCEHCGHELEAIQKMADAPLRDCPQCRTPALKKLISASGFRLAGGGWYETDFKAGDKKNVAKKEEAPAAAAATPAPAATPTGSGAGSSTAATPSAST